MKLTRFEPFRIADLLHNDLGRTGTASGWQPATDIIEYKDAFLVRLDLPGVESSAIEISTDKGILSISGERAAFENSEEATLTRRERASGRFDRRFSLPEMADVDAIRAQSKDGILEVRIPKIPEVQARKITVEAA
ncbi:MAG: Hsp20/alpha crystallin family protein [Woeseiaceae bacterium]|nr:Hsp20/alpha crystallin family protein [Woeseiaceae bacterium]